MSEAKVCGKLYAPWIDPCRLAPKHDGLHEFLDRECTEAFRRDQLEMQAEYAALGQIYVVVPGIVSIIRADDNFCDSLAAVRELGAQPAMSPEDVAAVNAWIAEHKKPHGA